MNDIKVSLRGFLANLCDTDKLGDNDDIFAGGFVNSLYLVQMLAFIQSEFNIELDEDDYDMNNFRSIAAAASFVERKHQ